MAEAFPRIERVKLRDLPALANRLVERAKPGDFIPITKHRAAAMLHNPYASPDDTAMLVAWEGDECVGYFGTMSVMLEYKDRLHKVFWLTTWNVAPRYIGKGLGSALMQAALDLDVDLAIVGSKPARRVSAKFGFHEIAKLPFTQVDFGLAGRYNPISLFLRGLRKLFRFPIESINQPVARFFETLLAPLLQPLARALALRPYRGGLAGLSIKEVGQVRPFTERRRADSQARFFHDHTVTNWMLARPWVLPSGQSESERLSYEFTDARPGFRQIGWEVSAEGSGEYLGYVCFQLSRIRGRQTLKVLDHEWKDAELLLPLALKMAAEKKAALIEGPAGLAALGERSWLGRLLVQRRVRTTQVHPRAADSPLGRAWQQLEPSYLDGDTAFT